MLRKLSVLAVLVFSQSMAFAADREEIDRSLDLKPGGEVVIEVQNGKAAIQGWDKNEIHVVGKLDEKALGYEFDVSGKDATFKVEMPKRYNNSNKKGSDLKIFVPSKSTIRFDGVNTDVVLNKLFSGTHVHSVNGDIQGDKLTGRVDINTVNGDIKVSELKGRISLETVNGDIRDSGSTGSKAYFQTVNGDIATTSDSPEIDIENVNGDITLNLADVEELSIDTVNGDIEADFKLVNEGEIKITTVGGDVELDFDGKVSATFDINSHAGGRITNKLSNQKQSKAKYGPSRWLNMTLGNGAGNVEITTVSGNVKLK